VNAPVITLPVYLTAGEHTAEVGELTLTPGEPIRPALAALFRAAAEAFEADPEGGNDGTP
jgi:hypothetical protein